MTQDNGFLLAERVTVRFSGLAFRQPVALATGRRQNKSFQPRLIGVWFAGRPLKRPPGSDQPR